MSVAAPPAASPRTRLTGYLLALLAGATWGTTGVLSTGLYGEGARITGIGFWRVLLGLAGLGILSRLGRRGWFRADRQGWLIVGLFGGAMVALFEVGYQFAISGVGVAGAAALLYTGPVLVAILAWPILGERLTVVQLALAVVVTSGAILTVRGGSNLGAEAVGTNLAAGVTGGALAALSYAATTLVGRWAAPRYGVMRVLCLELVGGTLILGLVLPALGLVSSRFERPLAPPVTLQGWIYLGALALLTVVLANVFFFGATRRIEAAPTAVAATIEPVVATLLALAFLGQTLTSSGVLGLVMVVGGVAAGYWRQAVAGAPEGQATR
ncbi:MAG TPA: DMT family transporter [Gemmatimonadales bacterium]|nr:DMT family transporter [Gemmatimonadales bacterium]